MAQDWQKELPEAQGSKVVPNNRTKELYRASVSIERDSLFGYDIRILARWDDDCRNGSNSFYCYYQVVMADSNRESERLAWDDPCLRKLVAAVPKELLDLKKWNGFHSFGPWYYMENTLYQASDTDCHGLRKGEVQQIRNGKTGLPAWVLRVIDADGNEHPLHDSKITTSVDQADCPPCPYTVEYRPWCRIGEGKKRELDHARATAVWPEATNAQLTDENLATALKQRLPALLVEFRTMIESLGFDW